MVAAGLVLCVLGLSGPIVVESQLPASAQALSRREFVRRLRESNGDTPAEVRQRLGEPDRVSDGVWSYGVDAKTGVVTLGQLSMSEDGCWPFTLGPEAPSAQTISESQLRSELIWLKENSRSFQFSHQTDPLTLIRVANHLRPLGKEKVLAVLSEYSRLASAPGSRDTWIFWLMRTMFDLPADLKYMPLPRIGAYYHPRDMTLSPRYPVMLMDDIPATDFQGALLRGSAEPAWCQIPFFRNCNLRTKDLEPSDDPFLTYVKIAGSRLWPHGPSAAYHTRFTIPYSETEGYLLREILSLVRNVYRPKRFEGAYGGGPLDAYVNGMDFEDYHGEFLALRPRWDKKKQDYVRG